MIRGVLCSLVVLLTAFAAQAEGILNCNVRKGAPPMCVVRGMPLLSQGDPRIDPALQAYKNVGCYDASIVSVILAAQFNRDTSLTSSGRTKTFLAIPAGNAPKEVEQLEQQYLWAKANDDKKIVNGNLVQRYYMHEALADTGGKIKEQCDPYVYGNCSEVTNSAGHAFRTYVKDDHVTNEYVIDLMKKNYVPMIAYGRYSLKIGLGKPKFFAGVPHKVVFSGFRPNSKYPLRINDVGSGTRHWVRLATDLSERGFGPASVIPYPLPTKTFLEYEDLGKKISDPVLFIEHIDALKINTADDVRGFTKILARK